MVDDLEVACKELDNPFFKYAVINWVCQGKSEEI